MTTEVNVGTSKAAQLETGHDEEMPTLAQIQNAAGRLVGVARRTELIGNETFSRLSGCQVYLKMENMQRTGSFKVRGAYNKISRLAELPGSQRPTGVIAASAGNHAQGVASAGALRNLPATVVLPLGASLTKVSNCREMGAEVIQYGATLEEAAAYAKNLAHERDLLFVHPYDDWDIIAGQGTLGLELLQDLPEVETIVVPLGGGGLLSGIALAVKQQRPDVRIIGVQTEAVAPYEGYIQTGHYRPNLPGATTIADGIRVKSPGSYNSRVLRRYVDDVVTVDDGQISQTIVALLERTHSVVEGAGAVGLAALLHHKIAVRPDEKVIAVISGGNIDMTLVGKIIDYGLAESGKVCAVAVRLPDTPGALYTLVGYIAHMGMNIRQIDHRRGELHVPVGESEVVVQIESKDLAQQHQLINYLNENNLPARIVT